MMTPRRNYIFSNEVGRQHLQSSSTSHRRVAEPLRQTAFQFEVLTGISLTSAGKPHSLNVVGEGMVRPQQLPPSFRTSPLAARA